MAAIKNIKINGIKNPVGYDLDKISVSYYIDGKPEGDIMLHILDGNGDTVHSQSLDYAKNYDTDICFTPAKQSEYILEISCGNARARATFETGTNFDCDFITPAVKIDHPVIFKRFACKNVKKARLYVTGVGLYTARINGKKAGDEYLTPYCNDYGKYLQYQTYDVTDYLSDENILEISLGNGWYKGRFGLKHKSDIYGSEYACACKLVLWCDDGMHVIKSDESFSARRSCVTESGIYDGEHRDDTLDCSEIFPVKKYGSKFNVVERVSLPVKVKHLLRPELFITPKGEKVLDFGQNFSGIVSFENFLPKGKSVTLKAGEVLSNGCFFRDNLRTAKAEFKYISDGASKQVEPEFTFFGFRYMLVEYDGEINENAFVGKALYSDLDQTVTVNTDHEKLNRLLENCVWGQRSNFLDVPTDCPQRDERIGWTGDAEVFCGAACYQMDCRTFYAKYLKDIAIEQDYLDGRIPEYAPGFNECGAAYCAWEDAVTIIPWTSYEFYGDRRSLAQAYPAMKRYVDKLIETDNERGGGRLYNYGFHLGDWLSQDGVVSTALKAGTNEYFIASCYYYKSVKIVADAAKALGRIAEKDYYGEISSEIYKAILDEYFTASGRLSIDTQTAYALCVMFDIYSNKERLYTSFRKRMKKDCYTIKGGFVGATKLVQALFKCGLDDEAFRILFSEKYPSWLYCVNHGATTIWERWNALLPDGSMSDPALNSFNHYAYGAVAEAVYGDIAGVIRKGIAFKSVVIKPKFDYRLKKFAYNLISPSGEFKIEYTVQTDGGILFTVNIPYGVEAKLDLNGKTERLGCGENRFVLPANAKITHPFSVDSKLCDVMANERARSVFAETAPSIHAYFSHNVVGMEGYSLRELCSLKSFFVPADKLEKLDAKLKNI